MVKATLRPAVCNGHTCFSDILILKLSLCKKFGCSFFYLLLTWNFRQHRGKIIGLAFSPTGNYLYSACSMGSLSLYDASSDRYELLRLLGNTVVRGEKRGPEALAVSPDGRRMAFIGPSEYTVCVVDAKSLSEVWIMIYYCKTNLICKVKLFYFIHF